MLIHERGEIAAHSLQSCKSFVREHGRRAVTDVPVILLGMFTSHELFV